MTITKEMYVMGLIFITHNTYTNTSRPLFTSQQEEEQEVRVSQLFNTLLFTQQEEEEEEEQQEVRVSQLFNTLLFTQQEEEQEQEVRVSELFNTLLFTQQLQEEKEKENNKEMK